MNETTEPDFGPLAGLIGTWTGDKGLDLAPEPDGSEQSPYYETLSFEAVGNVENAESQLLAAVRYVQVVRRKSNGELLHDQTGYWIWDAAAQTVMQSLTIPRAVCVLAGGAYSAAPTPGAGVCLQVKAKLGDPDWGVVQSPFMWDKARTLSFSHELRIEDDKLSYVETTRLEIYGRSFEHKDHNELSRQR